MAWQPGIITTDVPALPASGLADRLREFVEKPWAYRRRHLQSAYRTAFDGYSFQGQTDSLNQGPEDALHSFVLSDFSPVSDFPAEFQRFLRDDWPLVIRTAREIERGLLVDLGVEGLLEPYDASYGHMMSANYYPPPAGAQPDGSLQLAPNREAAVADGTPLRPAGGLQSSAKSLRLTEHPDVSLLTLFPFGVEAGFEYQEPDGAWRALAPTRQVVGFAGELLEWLTAGRIQALNHRVAPAGGARFSFSLFSLPRPGTRIMRESSREAISVEAYIDAHLSRWL